MKPFANSAQLGNWLLGISFWHWAVLGLVSPADAWSTVRWCIAVLHLVPGGLLIFRDAARRTGTWQQWLACLPAFVFAGLIFLAALPTDQWPAGPVALFVVATCWTVASFLFLGTSFAVFPSLRKVVSGGPYRLVRHPAYLGETGLLLACVWVAAEQPRVWFFLVGALATMVVRIVVEERVLGSDPRYRAYSETVRWHLLPRVW